MARKTINYTVTEDGRDKGKVFLLTEMSSSRAESWAMRAILALMSNGVEVPEGFENLSMAAMAEIGIKALSGLKWEDAEPLLDEMWQCCRMIPDPSKPQIVRNLIEEDIEEVETRVRIRMEIWKLHVGFLKAVARSTSAGKPAPARVKN